MSLCDVYLSYCSVCYDVAVENGMESQSLTINSCYQVEDCSTVVKVYCALFTGGDHHVGIDSDTQEVRISCRAYPLRIAV